MTTYENISKSFYAILSDARSERCLVQMPLNHFWRDDLANYFLTVGRLGMLADILTHDHGMSSDDPDIREALCMKSGAITFLDEIKALHGEAATT